ncbi:MAG: geranylgeranyl reductase family protein [Cyanobacteria bacterium P01_D01_bin.73]
MGNEPNQTFDCIVIGAGPGGSAAAIALAQQNRQVLLLEKDSWPRDRPCGGGVAPAAGHYFNFDLSPAINNTLTQLQLSWKFGDTIDVDVQTAEPLWSVDRRVFDDFLVQQAIAQGVTFQANCPATNAQYSGDRWTIATPNATYSAPYLIGADGPNGPSARWLQLEPPTSHLGAVLVTNGTVGARAYFEFGALNNGFVWALPKGKQTWLCASTVRGKDVKEAKLQQTLKAFAKHLGVTPTSHFQTMPLRLWDGDRPLHGNHGLLVGDAAGVSDPFSGEGVRQAIFTGSEAAKTIDSALKGNAEAIAEYSKTIAQELGSDLAWAQRLTSLFHRFPKLAYKIGTRRPSVKTYIGKMMCGDMSYSYVAQRAIRRISASLGNLIPGFGKS